MSNRGYEVELRTNWKCPEDGGAPLLTMANIVKPLQGPGCQPRTILGASAWDRLRKRTYYLAGYKSEISKVDLSKPGMCHSHEVFSVDYEKGIAIFKRCVCISPMEHVYFIHSGRALTLHKRGNPMYATKQLLDGAENGFRLIHEWNKAHPDQPKLKAYQTFLEYLKCPDLELRMRQLIDKYEIEFWGEDPKKIAPWRSWKVIVGNKEYPTPYENYKAWEKAMQAENDKDIERNLKNPFAGGVFDDINAILAEEKETN